MPYNISDMQKILVTGGAGFIGSHTVVELAAAGYIPIVIDNFSNSDVGVIERLEKLVGSPIRFYNQDFQDINKLKQIIIKESVVGVIHFAAYKQVGESVSNPLKYYKNNVAGLIDLLMVSESLKLKYFVFSSSCTVYGNTSNLAVTEEFSVQPAESPYGATKQIGEIILSDSVRASKIMNALSLRYFNPIGAHPSGLIGELPKGTPANLIPFVTQTAAGIRDKLTVFGDDYPTKDGSCIRDYIHVVDLAKAHVKALSYLEKQKPGFYDHVNVGTGKGTSVFEVIKTFEQVTGIKLAYEIGPRRPGDLTSIYASTDKAMKTLGWSAKKTLANAMADAWRWQESLK